MPYSVDTYSRNKTITINDGTIDNSLDVLLIGKNYSGYGEVQNENFVYLLENFAGINPPSRPLNGQIWYDSSTRKIKFYDSAVLKWRTTSGAESSSTQPTGLSVGDLWFDNANNQLYAYNGTDFILIGPQGVAGLGTTEMQTRSLKDINNDSHLVIIAFVNGRAVYVVSAQEFIPDNTSKIYLGSLSLYPKIYKGITLINTNEDGITSQLENDTFWGTSSSTLGLIDDRVLTAGQLVKVSDLLLKDDVNFTNLIKFSDSGFRLGDSEDLEVKIDNDGLTPIFNVRTSNSIKFKTSNGINTPLILVDNNIYPGTTGVTNLGSLSYKFNNIYAEFLDGIANKTNLVKIDDSATDATWNSLDQSTWYRSAKTTSTAYTIAARDNDGNLTAVEFLGNATSATTAENADQSDLLLVDTVYRSAKVDTVGAGTPDSIACRDSAGNLNAVQFQGVATTAVWADLAEKYLADKEYEVGTVVSIGGEKEVTECRLGDRALGAVSAYPAFKMNDNLQNGTYIALKGRVPVKVEGKVNKGDKLISGNNGCAIAVENKEHLNMFAIALETNLDLNIKLVEAVIL